MGVLSEKAEWINGLAEIYQKQGYKVNACNSAGGQAINEIKDRIIAVAGLAERTVMAYLSEEYKQEQKGSTLSGPRVSASERVENELGPEVARFRKEMAPGQFHSCNEHLP